MPSKAPKPPKTQWPEAEKDVSDSGSAEEDLGRTESQQVLEYMRNITSKPAAGDDFLLKFRTQVEHDEAELESLIKGLNHECEQDETKFDALMQSWLSSGTDKNVGKEEQPSPVDHSNALIKESKRLLKDYEKLNSLTATSGMCNLDKLLKVWEEDQKEIEAAIIHKRDAVIQRVQQSLDGSSNEAAEDGHGNDEQAQLVADLFGQNSIDWTLFKTLTHVEKGAGKMVKDLPSDSGR